jgi:hypothetical protein
MTQSVRGEPRKSRLRSALSRLTADRSDLEAAEETERSTAMGGTLCSQLHDRSRTRVFGVLRTVTLRPRAGVPALEAEIFDGSGTLSVIWLGRRAIAGVEPGRRIAVEGLVSCADGRSVMFNPRYELFTGEAR